MSRKFKFPHVKHTKARGNHYYYFRTGKLNDKGREILVPLPPPDAPNFGDKYASCLAAKTRRANAESVLTVTDLIGIYKKSPHFNGKSVGTQRIYGIYLAQFQAMFPTAPAQEIRREWITRLIDSRADKPGAANSLLRTIGALYRWGRKRGHVTATPTLDIEPLEMGEHEPWPAWLLEKALESDDDRVRLSVHLLYFTALRIGDVVALRWQDVRGGFLHVVPQKTSRHRIQLVIPLHNRLVAELARHERGIGTIIPGEKGRPLHQQTLRDHLQTWAAELGLKVVPHGLRKNAVNALLEAGCSAAETAAISGQSLRMVEYYAKMRAQGALAEAAVYKWNQANEK